MSCKNCTCNVLPKQKNLFLDIDDTLMDYMLKFHRFLRAELKISIPNNHLPEEWGHVNLIGDKQELFDQFTQKYNEKLHIIPGAVEFTKKAKKMGWNIILITNHPHYASLERMKLLNKFGLVFDVYYSLGYRLTDGTSKRYIKSEFIKELGYDQKNNINVILDDKFSYVKEFVDAGLGYGVAMDRPYNHNDIESHGKDEKITITPSNEVVFNQVKDSYKLTLKLLKELSK